MGIEPMKRRRRRSLMGSYLALLGQFGIVELVGQSVEMDEGSGVEEVVVVVEEVVDLAQQVLGHGGARLLVHFQLGRHFHRLHAPFVRLSFHNKNQVYYSQFQSILVNSSQFQSSKQVKSQLNQVYSSLSKLNQVNSSFFKLNQVNSSSQVK